MHGLFEPLRPVSISMWGLSRPWGEFVLRGVLVDLFVRVLFRLQGKREVGQLAPLDLVLILLVSNAVQNAMNAGDNRVTGGFLLGLSLAAVHGLVGHLMNQGKRMEPTLQGQPRLLVHHGGGGREGHEGRGHHAP